MNDYQKLRDFYFEAQLARLDGKFKLNKEFPFLFYSYEVNERGGIIAYYETVNFSENVVLSTHSIYYYRPHLEVEKVNLWNAQYYDVWFVDGEARKEAQNFWDGLKRRIFSKKIFSQGSFVADDLLYFNRRAKNRFRDFDGDEEIFKRMRLIFKRTSIGGISVPEIPGIEKRY